MNEAFLPVYHGGAHYQGSTQLTRLKIFTTKTCKIAENGLQACTPTNSWAASLHISLSTWMLAITRIDRCILSADKSWQLWMLKNIPHSDAIHIHNALHTYGLKASWFGDATAKSMSHPHHATHLLNPIPKCGISEAQCDPMPCDCVWMFAVMRTSCEIIHSFLKHMTHALPWCWQSCRTLCLKKGTTWCNHDANSKFSFVGSKYPYWFDLACPDPLYERTMRKQTYNTCMICLQWSNHLKLWGAM